MVALADTDGHVQMAGPQARVAKALGVMLRPAQPATQKPESALPGVVQRWAMHLAQPCKLSLQIHEVIKAFDQNFDALLTTDPLIRCVKGWFVLNVHDAVVVRVTGAAPPRLYSYYSVAMFQTYSAQPLMLQTGDGVPLAATHHCPARDASTHPQFIVVGSATAVPRGFYRRFGEYAASRGLHVIATDYRGIGESKAMCPIDARGRPTLKGYQMQYADWSRHDLAAAVAYADQRGAVYLVGHSLGGHALGQLPNHGAVRAAYFCGSGAGWAGWMPPMERIKVWALWNLLGPMATAWLGYQPMSQFGMGEDLPMGVYRDWKRWCGFAHYFFDDPAADAQAIAQQFAHVRCPIAACVSTDDKWAPPASRDAFFKGYTHAPVQAIDLSPKALGVQEIGHMGYFRAAVGERLWPQMLEWLGYHGLEAGQTASKNRESMGQPLK